MLLLNKRPTPFVFLQNVCTFCLNIYMEENLYSRKHASWYFFGNTNIAILIIIRKIYDNFFLDTENRNRSEKLKSNKVDKKWIKRPQGQMQIGETWTLVSFCSADLSMTVSFISCSFLFICVHFAVKDDGCFQRLDWLIDLDMPSFDLPSRRSGWGIR